MYTFAKLLDYNQLQNAEKMNEKVSNRLMNHCSKRQNIAI